MQRERAEREAARRERVREIERERESTERDRAQRERWRESAEREGAKERERGEREQRDIERERVQRTSPASFLELDPLGRASGPTAVSLLRLLLPLCSGIIIIAVLRPKPPGSLWG